MRTTRRVVLMVGWLGAVGCGGSGPKLSPETGAARAQPDSEPAPAGAPIPIGGKVPCATIETVASGDSVAVTFSKNKLKVDKQEARDTAHQPGPRLVDCLTVYSDTAHQPGP